MTKPRIGQCLLHPFVKLVDGGVAGRRDHEIFRVASPDDLILHQLTITLPPQTRNDLAPSTAWVGALGVVGGGADRLDDGVTDVFLDDLLSLADDVPVADGEVCRHGAQLLVLLDR